MIRRICVIALAISLMATLSYAAPREGQSKSGLTNVTNIGVVGEDVAGVPGYIEFVTEDISGKEMRWLMYVTSDGVVYVASSATVETASPTRDTNWIGTGTPIGTKVGGQ